MRVRENDRGRTKVLWFAMLATALAATSTAEASPSYPSALARKLGMPCPPACTLCHTTPKGGELTVNTPFGTAARRRGLLSGETGLLFDVIDQIELEAVDSDADDTPDIVELRGGADPNVAGSPPLQCYEPEEEPGCLACSARSESSKGTALGAASLFIALVALRRSASGVRTARR